MVKGNKSSGRFVRWSAVVIVLGIFFSCSNADVIKFHSGGKLECIVGNELQSWRIYGKERPGKYLEIKIKAGKVVLIKSLIKEIQKASEKDNNLLLQQWAEEKAEKKKKSKKKSSTSTKLTKKKAKTPKKTPGLIHVVQCNDGIHSYAVCLPSYYDQMEKCPVLFCFDPGGLGRLAVHKFAFAAERYGWIVVGSLDAKNGPWKDILEAQTVMLEDIPKRYRTDEKKYYAAGFSGGASMSFALAYNNPTKFKGVIACAGCAGNKDSVCKKIPVFYCVGRDDFAGLNSVIVDYAKLNEQKIKTEIIFFSGGHIWPNDYLLKNAVKWIVENSGEETESNQDHSQADDPNCNSK